MIRERARRTAAALGATGAGVLLLAAAAGAQPPTSLDLYRATDRFLERHAGPAAAGGLAGRPAPSPAATPILPEQRIISLYGAPQMGQTILGSRTPAGAARQLAAQSRPYGELGDRPVLGAFDLVSVFATASGGADGLYRSRQDDRVIEIYLEQARAARARLILDIQPGRSTFLAEIRSLREWIAEPDVDVALDPEWNVGRRGVPGRTQGRVGARQITRVQKRLAEIVADKGLPAKLLVVHQFRRGSIRRRNRIRPRDGVQTVLNFDGIGSPSAKQAGYGVLSVPRLFDGFSVFYRRDEPLIKPAAVLALSPEPDFLLYQ